MKYCNCILILFVFCFTHCFKFTYADGSIICNNITQQDSVLGKGANGIVYLEYLQVNVTGKQCVEGIAVKYGKDKNACKVLDNEFKILSKLTHASRVRVPVHVDSKRFPKLKMQYTNVTNSVRGKCKIGEEYLSESIELGNIYLKFDTETTVQDHKRHLYLLQKWINQVIKTVHTMHQSQIIYCDWNMMNILISGENQDAYVIDFGNSVLVAADTVVPDPKIKFTPTFEFAAPVVYEKLYDRNARIFYYGNNTQQLWQEAKYSDYYAVASLFLEVYMEIKYTYKGYHQFKHTNHPNISQLVKNFRIRTQFGIYPTSKQLCEIRQYRHHLITYELKQLQVQLNHTELGVNMTVIDNIKSEEKFLQIISGLFNNITDIDQLNRKTIRKAINRRPNHVPDDVEKLDCACCNACFIM